MTIAPILYSSLPVMTASAGVPMSGSSCAVGTAATATPTDSAAAAAANARRSRAAEGGMLGIRTARDADGSMRYRLSEAKSARRERSPRISVTCPECGQPRKRLTT